MATLIPDNDLVRRLPLPLAQLYRRAHNAKTPLDRHNAAYCLWEAALKLLGSVAIVAHAERGVVAPELVDRLQNLARPSLGHWWEFVRLLVPPLADSREAGFAAVRELLLGRGRDDLPRAAGLDAALRESLDGTTGGRVTVRLSELFERMVRYRNQELGHGALGQRDAAFYDRMGRAMLLGLGEILARLDVLAGRKLVYVADVRRQASGTWLIERFELAGETFRRLESMERPESETSTLPRPGRLYLDAPGDLQTDFALGPGWSLHPLLLAEFETAEVFFLNSRRGRRRTEYLGYHPGRVIERTDLGDDQRELLARILGVDVDAAKVERWAATSQAEELPLAPTAQNEEPRRRLGEFELLSELGRGGMGVVYRAWQPSLGRQVALKCLLKAGDPKADARFNREIHALGRVEHPNLVKVFTSGVEAERWFYAMELVDGATLAAVCGQLQTAGSGARDVDLATWHASLSTACLAARESERPLSTIDDPGSQSAGSSRAARSAQNAADRGYVLHIVELARQVADAAHALHEGGVIHRDIKPDNILVAPDGSNAVLMDLGLAQLADESTGRLTTSRQFVGTLRYSSPEQVLSVPLDRRSDVYSLGATLWELLTLRPLWGATEELSTPDLMLKIQHADPDPPRKFNPRVPADLDAIVLKCLEKDRARRYATAAELSADLARWMRGAPVHAQPPTLAYLLGKALRRHRGRAALAAALVLALILGTAAALTHQANRRILRARAAAETAKAEAEQSRNLALTARDGEANARAKIESLKEVLRVRLVESTDILSGDEALGRGNPFGCLPWFADALRLEEGDTRREKANLIRLSMAVRQCPRLAQIVMLDGPVHHAEFSKDGRCFLTAGPDYAARVWDVATGQPLTPSMLHESESNDEYFRVTHKLVAAFSPNASRIVTANPDHSARVWDAATGKPATPPLMHADHVNDAAFSPDGRRIVTASDDHTARLWDATTGLPAAPPIKHESSVRHAEFSSDGTRVLTVATDDGARVWDSETGKPITPPLEQQQTGVHASFSPDGHLVLTACYNMTARVWNAATGKPVTPPIKLATTPRYAAFSPDGRFVLVVCDYYKMQVWDVATAAPVGSEMLHTNAINHTAFSRDGRYVVSASKDNSVRLWDPTIGQSIAPPLMHTNEVMHAEFSPDGRFVLTSGADGIVRIWDLATIADNPPLFTHDGPVSQATFDPSGQLILTAGEDKSARVWDANSGELIFNPIEHPDKVKLATFSPDGQLILTVCDDNAARLWDANTGESLAPDLKHTSSVTHAAFSPDGRSVVTSSADSTARVWNVTTGKPTAPPLKHAEYVHHVAFSPDGRRVVTASADKTARIWDAASGTSAAPPLSHAASVLHAEFSPDGKRVVTSCYDHTARLWDTTTGQPAGSPMKHLGTVTSATFSRDGRHILTTSNDHTARVWDAASGAPISPPLQHAFDVNHAEFSADGTRVVTASADDTARVWDAENGQPVTIPFKHKTSVIHASFSLDGRRVVTASDDSARVWELAVQTRSANVLILLAELISSSRIEPRGTLVPLDQSEVRERWKTLVEKHPAELSASDQELLAWHRREADDCEERATWNAAITHLTAIIEATAPDERLYARRGDAYAELGRWDQASADFSKALATHPEDREVFHLSRRLAYLALVANHVDEFRRAIARLNDLHAQLKDPNQTVPIMAFVAALVPEALADYGPLLRLTRNALDAAEESSKYKHECLNALGALTYRAGRPDEAVEHLRKGMLIHAFRKFKIDPLEGDPTDWLFFAMAHARLGHAAEAREWLDKATKWIDSNNKDHPVDDTLGAPINWRNWLILNVLRHEAESVVNGKTPAAASPKK